MAPKCECLSIYQDLFAPQMVAGVYCILIRDLIQLHASTRQYTDPMWKLELRLERSTGDEMTDWVCVKRAAQ